MDLILGKSVSDNLKTCIGADNRQTIAQDCVNIFSNPIHTEGNNAAMQEVVEYA